MDLIDRSELQYKMLEILQELDSLGWYEQAKPDEVKELVDKLYNIVLDAKKIDAQPVKHGTWIKLPRALDSNENPCKCSYCGHVISFYSFYQESKYCDACGAIMDGESDA